MKYTITLILLLINGISISQNTNISNTNIFDGEPFMAIDPLNNQHIVAAWMGFQVGQNVAIKSSISNNGGVTWSAAQAIPHNFAGNTSADVSLQYDNSGNLFLCYIDYSSSDFSNGAIMIRKSTDGGLSWGTAVEAISINDCPGKLCVDRPWMVIDVSGGVNDGTIYVTSMNADQPTMISAPYNPYLTVSDDNGVSFSTPRFLDTTNFLSGNVITQPMPSPAIGQDGKFYAAYPSYETSQSPFAHIYLAESTTKGISLDHSNVLTIVSPGVSDVYAKKGSLLIADKVSPNHLVFFALTEEEGDADVFYIETYDGVYWTSPVRVNQDAVANGKMQDLVWADFNESGDLAVAWRDRRNASGSGYQTETEIYAAIRIKDSTVFEQDFKISSAQASHDVVLESAGNDFMNVRFLGDTMYAIWGDVRSGTLNIFFNKTNVLDQTSSVSIITEENPLSIQPNPADKELKIDNFDEFESLTLYNVRGELIDTILTPVYKVENLPSGAYFIVSRVGQKSFTSRIQVQH